MSGSAVYYDLLLDGTTTSNKTEENDYDYWWLRIVPFENQYMGLSSQRVRADVMMMTMMIQQLIMHDSAVSDWPKVYLDLFTTDAPAIISQYGFVVKPIVSDITFNMFNEITFEIVNVLAFALIEIDRKHVDFQI